MQTVESHRQFINRSNNETPMLLRYRQVRGGSLLLEYPPIPTRGPGAATRKVDGVLLPDVAELETSRGRSRVFDWELATARERLALDELVAGSKTEILQAKNSRLGPYLIGQTLFSRDLMRSSVGVAIAGPSSTELLRIAKGLSLQVVHDRGAGSSGETRSLLSRTPALVQKYVVSNGGSTVSPQAFMTASMLGSGLVVDAILLPDEPSCGVRPNLGAVRGAHAVAVCSTHRRIGMYVMGAAVCALHRLRDLGAARAGAVILCRQSDTALVPLLRDYPEIKVHVAS
jgi:hypothetical protein